MIVIIDLIIMITNYDDTELIKVNAYFLSLCRTPMLSYFALVHLHNYDHYV